MGKFVKIEIDIFCGLVGLVFVEVLCDVEMICVGFVGIGCYVSLILGLMVIELVEKVYCLVVVMCLKVD